MEFLRRLGIAIEEPRRDPSPVNYTADLGLIDVIRQLAPHHGLRTKILAKPGDRIPETGEIMLASEAQVQISGKDPSIIVADFLPRCSGIHAQKVQAQGLSD